MKRSGKWILRLIYLLFAGPVLLLLAASFTGRTGLSLEQYRLAFSDARFLESLKNAVVITLPALAIHVPVSITSGLLLARGKFKGIRLLNGIYLLALLLPFQVIMMPVYKMSHAVGLFDTQFAVVILAAFSPLGPLIMATLIKGVSEEQWEAVSIETSSVWKKLRHIILPQIAAGIILLVIITFADIWNMVEQPLILLSATSKKPISLAFNDFMKGNTAYLWAGSSVYAMPIIVLYIIISRLMRSPHSKFKK